MSDVLQRLYKLDKSFAQELEKLLQNDKYVGGLLQLPEKELIQLVNYLDNTLNRFTHIGVPSRKCLLVLRKICSAKKVLTAAYDIPGTLSSSGGAPIAHGGSCDVFQGTLTTEVCIKKIRISSIDDQDVVKESFCKEAVVWKRLDHPNIVPFKGITLDPLQLVSEWMPGGELRNYIKQNPDTSRINLLLGIAKGLAYLHSYDVVHGDLKGPNIVVDGSGNARITDFGLTSIIRDPSSVASNSDGHGFTPWWTAPEILREGIPATKKSDIFSFGMIIYEAFSGKVPFHDVSAQAAQASIMNGRRPKRPDNPKPTDALWRLAERCWAARARDRPEVGEVIEVLKGINSSKIVQVKNPPPTKPKPSDHDTPQKSEGGDGGVIVPYDVGAPPPVQTPPPPPNAGGNERPAHILVQIVGGGTTNEPPQRPPTSADNRDPLATGSTAEVVIEREPLKIGEDTIVKTEKDERTQEPAESTTTNDPLPTTRETPQDTRNDNVAGSSGLVDDPNKLPLPTSSPGSGPEEDTASTVRPAANQQGGQTSKHPGGQPEQPLVQKPANSHRNHDKLAGQDQGPTTNTHAATLELPISVVTEKPDESNAPPRQGSPTPLKPRPPKSEQPKPQQPMDPRKPPVPQPPEQNKRKKCLCC